MREVLRSKTLSQAHSVHAALEAAGIDSVVEGEHSVAIVGGEVSVQVVNDADLESALAVLSQLETRRRP